MKQHPYWRPANKVHPELKQVREEAGALTDAEKKRIEDAKKAEEERQERKRRKFLEKHGIDPDSKPDKGEDFFDVREGQTLGVNLTVGCRVGNKNSRQLEDNATVRNTSPNYRDYGRISRQSPVQKSGVLRGYVDAMRDFEKAYHPSPNGVHRDKPVKAKWKKVETVEKKKGIIDRVVDGKEVLYGKKRK